MKKILAMVLSLSLLMTMGASSLTFGAKNTLRDSVTLKILSPSNFDIPGLQDNPVANEIEKHTGVKMDIISDSNDRLKLKLYLASGEMPDICFANKADLKQILDGGNAIPLNDLLNSNGQYILKNNAIALKTANVIAGNTNGKYYFIPHKINPAPYQNLEYKPWIGSLLRWDYYKELGYPKAKTVDDFINILVQMQKKHPKTADGKKTYGMAGFSDWGNWGYYVTNMYSLGYTEVTNAVFGKDNKTVTYRYAADGPFFKGVEIFYKAQKAGILDPDSFTMKYDNYVEKAKNGQLLSIGAGWIADGANAALAGSIGKDKGFEAVPLECFNTSWAHSATSSQAGYHDEMAFISKSCKNPQKAMDLLNYLHSYEGSRLALSGIKGDNWVVNNGKPEWKEETFNASQNDKDFSKKTGIGLYGFMAGYDDMAIDPTDKGLISLSKSEAALIRNMTPLDKDFSNYYKAQFPGKVWDNLVKQKKAKLPVANFYYSAFSPADPDDIAKIHSNIDQYLASNVAKLILAKSDSDFKTKELSMIKDMQKLGLDKENAWCKKQMTDADAIYKKIIK